MEPEATLAGARWLRAPASQDVLRALEDGGGARFVGGAVRDTLLDPLTDVADLDIATALLPEESMRRLALLGANVVPTGLAHGTITARLGGRNFEVTTLRRDRETDGRHAEVEFTTDFAADAARRDFTINAMSCDRSGRLFDHVGGLADLRNGRVRFVGDPATRIREDYLRILRFFRFVARFQNGPPDEPALAACALERAGLRRLSGERVWHELKRLLVAPRAAASLTAMADARVWNEFLPGPPDLASFARLVRVDPGAMAVTRLAALLPKSLDKATVRRLAETVLKLSASERDLLLALGAPQNQQAVAGGQSGSHLDDAVALRREIYRRRSPAMARALMALAWTMAGRPPDGFSRLWHEVQDWSPPVLPIGGDDLIVRGVAPGPVFGRVLRAVEERWLASDFALDRTACLGLLDETLAAVAAAGRLDSPARPPT